MNLIQIQIPFSLIIATLLATTPRALQSQAPPLEPAGTLSIATTYAKRGPHWVGTRQCVVKTTTEGRSLPATLWYPR